MTDLTPGVLDGTAQRAFAYGACAGLALALHDRTGWPLVKVTDAHAVYPPKDFAENDLSDATLEDRARAENRTGMGAGGLHWLVAHPDGQLLDVDGLRDPVEVVDYYDGEADDGIAALGTASREDAWEEYVVAKGEPVPLEVCATFVDVVLTQL